MTSHFKKGFAESFGEALEEQQRRTRFDTNIGSAMSVSLASNSMTATSLAAGMGISRSYVSQVMTGSKHASPHWIDLVVRTLNLSEEDRIKLHRAAALDAGYKIEPDQK